MKITPFTETCTECHGFNLLYHCAMGAGRFDTWKMLLQPAFDEHMTTHRIVTNARS